MQAIDSMEIKLNAMHTFFKTISHLNSLVKKPVKVSNASNFTIMSFAFKFRTKLMSRMYAHYIFFASPKNIVSKKKIISYIFKINHYINVNKYFEAKILFRTFLLCLTLV